MRPSSASTRAGTLFLPELISLPGGWFLMGSACGRPDEAPAHRVYVRPFRCARLPVTNHEYAQFLESGAAAGAAAPRFWGQPRYDDPAQPVVGVAWADAVAFAAWLSRATGDAFRLPTEAEWEYAALAGREGALYPWGNEMPESAPGVPLDRTPLDGPARTGQGPVNPWGIGDLGWNIHEWCSDWYAVDYYAVSPSECPRGPSTGTRRSSRGGAWRHQRKVSRCAARSAIPPQLRYGDYGFRLLAEPG